MHFIRRAALRAASSPSTSVVSKQRSITTTSPFALRSKVQSGISSSVFRRFSSDEASSGQKPEGQQDRHVGSADGEQGSVKEAIDSVASYAGDAAASLTSNAERAKDTMADAATGAAAAAGIAYQPREDRRQYGDRGDRGGYGGDRGGRGGYGGDRGGDRSERRPYAGDRGGFGERPPRPERIIVPSNGIYVGNLLFDVTAADLEKEFKEFGTVKNVTIATDARGLSKGFGYVQYETIESANAAIAAKHQSVMEGRRLVVNYQSKSTRSGIQNPPSKTLFIGNLAFEMSDADLNKLFRDIRNVVDVRVAIDRRTGQPRGFAHADFIDVESAQKARDLLSGKDVYGRPLRVDFSTTPTDNRPPREY